MRLCDSGASGSTAAGRDCRDRFNLRAIKPKNSSSLLPPYCGYCIIQSQPVFKLPGLCCNGYLCFPSYFAICRRTGRAFVLALLPRRLYLSVNLNPKTTKTGIGMFVTINCISCMSVRSEYMFSPKVWLYEKWKVSNSHFS